MTNIYLIRHGEAEGNIFRRAHGWHDGRLTAKGQRQTDALAERFRDIHVDALYSSDLSRAVDTAAAITKYHDVPLITDPRLREIHVGTWEDLPWGNIAREQPEAMDAFNNDPDEWQVSGGENFRQVKRRMLTAIQDIDRRHDGQTVVCISHGMAIRALLALIMGVSSKEIYKLPHGDNTAVSLLSVQDGRPTVSWYNDSSHLSDELSTFARQSWWRDSANADPGNLIMDSMDIPAEMDVYLELYRQAWTAAHGSLQGFDEDLCARTAQSHYDYFPLCISKAVSGGKILGVSDIDVERSRAEGCGWLSLLCIDEAFRRRQLGAQLLGNAFYICRGLGFNSVRLNVAEENHGAIAFYREFGFRPVGEADGAGGRLLVMERELE